MEGAKIKNIVIIILLLLNGFLLVLASGHRFEDAHSQQTARESAIQVIRASGAQLEDSVVPREMTLGSMQAERDLEQEKRLAEKLLGGTVTVQARGGDVYRYYNVSGSIQIHSTGEFSALFEDGLFSLGEQDVETHATAVLSRLGFEAQVLEDAVVAGRGSVTCRQMLDGAPLLGCHATLHYADGQLTGISNGRRLVGTPYADGGKESITVATALMRLFNGLKDLGDVYNRVDSIVPAYTVSVSLSGPAQLTPAWYITTDTGAYQLDTVTGTLSRTSSTGHDTVIHTAGDMARDDALVPTLE